MNVGIDFPYLVKEIRQVRGLTQEQLARELGVTFGTVNGWENGKHKPIPVLASRLLEIAAAASVAPRQVEVPARKGTFPEGRRSKRRG